MLFSNCLLQCFHIIGTCVPPTDLGRFYECAFPKALERTSATTRREVQALGRHLLQTNFPQLMRACPASLTPLGVMFQDPKGDLADHKRPICCNGLFGSTVGIAFVDAYKEMYPEEVTHFIHALNRKMLTAEKFNLYKPLGKTLTKHISPTALDDEHADAWMLVKSNKEGPLPGARSRVAAAKRSAPSAAEEPVPPTLESMRDHEIEAMVKEALAVDVPLTQMVEKALAADVAITQAPKPTNEKELTEADIEQILRGIEEDPKKSAEALQDVDINEPVRVSSVVDVKHPERTRAADVTHESFEDYRHVLQNDPAFVGMHQHPRHGLLLVIIQVDGVNALGQTVYRGGAIFDPHTNKMMTHKNISSVIGAHYWTDEAGAKYVVKAVPWVRGLCGKYWTNVDRGTAHDDIEEFKRWFLLTLDKETKQPMLRLWSGAKGEANFNTYVNRLRRELRKRHQQRSASLPLQHGSLH